MCRRCVVASWLVSTCTSASRTCSHDCTHSVTSGLHVCTIRQVHPFLLVGVGFTPFTHLPKHRVEVTAEECEKAITRMSKLDCTLIFGCHGEWLVGKGIKTDRIAAVLVMPCHLPC